MAYILDMAGGTEYQGDELSCSHPLEARKHVTRPEHQVALRLAEIELPPSPGRTISPASIDLSALINTIDD